MASTNIIITFSIIILVLSNVSLTTSRTDLLHKSKDLQPTFGEPMQNITAAVGREATFSCVVNNIQDHQVAWFHKEKHTLLALQDKVITRNPRIRVSSQGLSTFSLHIHDVREEDQGTYACQVNSSPMKSQSGHLEVVVPPRFVEHFTSSDLEAPEDSPVSLRCVANGFPTPEIKWRREDGLAINIRSGGERESMMSVAGEYLNISKVQRLDSGAFICIASNGIQPATSKRIFLGVTFSPMIWTPKQTLVAPLGSDVVLECILEAYPHPVTFWSKANGPQIMGSGTKYETTVQSIPSTPYKSIMRLRIRNIHPQDFTSYSCQAKNSMGETKGTIYLYEGSSPSPSPTVTGVTDRTPSSSSNSWGESESSSGSESKRNKHFSSKGSAYNTGKKSNKDLVGSNKNSGHSRTEATRESEEKSTLTSLPKRSTVSSSSPSSLGGSLLRLVMLCHAVSRCLVALSLC